MNEARIEILQMLDTGKVTADEATRLLNALQRNMPVPSPTEPTIATATVTATSIPPAATPFRLTEWLQALAGSAAKQKVEEHFDWELDSTALQTIAVQTVNGSLAYVGATQETIAVHAHKVVKAPDAATAAEFARQVQIRIEPQAGVLRIYADYPKPPRHVEVQVTFAIQGPHAINLDGQSTNGHVTVTGVEGLVKARSTNGGVQLDGITGEIMAKSTNGDVQVNTVTLTTASHFASQNGSLRIHVQHGAAPITATTVNGGVSLTLPPTYNGQLDARTQNGNIRTDFPMQVTQRARNRVVGQIGGGGEALLKLQSQNGNITLVSLGGNQ